jgi:hypothetical protein
MKALSHQELPLSAVALQDIVLMQRSRNQWGKETSSGHLLMAPTGRFQ